MSFADYPDEYDPTEVEILPRAELTAIVDGLLRTHRPDRYTPGADWLDEVAGQVETKIAITEAKRIAARQMVGHREGRATRSVNKFLKSLQPERGTFEITPDWASYADEPVAFYDATEARIRVALRAMKGSDWRQFATHGRIDAQHRYDAEVAMYEAADWLASQQESELFAEWAERVAPRRRLESA